MAGIEVDLRALDELEAWMREHRASYARVGEYELRLEPLPPQPVVVVAPDQSTADPDEAERRSLETLLYSAGVDPEPFVAAMKRRS